MLQPTTPGTPDSTGGMLISAAGNAANEKRNKTIMSCFRDRTPSYTRSNTQHFIRYEQSSSGNIVVSSNTGAGRPEAVVLLKELRSRPNKLALLKSTSSRDLTRLVEMNLTNIDISPTSSSSSASSTGQKHNTNSKCFRYIEELKDRIVQLEEELHEQRSYTKNLEISLNELTKRVNGLSETRQLEKHKKSINKKQQQQQSITVQPSKLVAWMNLTNWWKHRPSIETLKQQNIYNDEPCFDTEIEMVLKHEIHKTVPKIVVDCCDLIEEKYRKSSESIEGIYRQCGDYNKIQTLRFKIDANDYDSLRQPNIDIHTLTGLLKLFLREIKSPLVSTNEVKTFIGKPNQWLLTDFPMKIDILKRLIRSLPEINRDTMDYLFKHFNKLTKVPLQQISADTLALSVTPSVFQAVQRGANHIEEIHLLLKESEVLADCVKIMIEYQHRIFECTADERRRQRRISVRKLRKTLSHPDLLFQNLF